MIIEQTVDIPADRRLTIVLPLELPVGRARVEVIVTPETAREKTVDAEDVCPLCAKYYDPRTGQPPYNAETMAALAEGDAMLRGEIPSETFHSLDELLADLRS